MFGGVYHFLLFADHFVFYKMSPNSKGLSTTLRFEVKLEVGLRFDVSLCKLELVDD